MSHVETSISATH